MSLRDDFQLDPAVVFLNHGSFGACPRPVFQVYQDWQRRLEQQPVAFLGRELNEQLKIARQQVGNYLNVDGNDLVFVPNATYGVNVVARSLKLQPGDEILSTDHEYGACERAWRFVWQGHGVNYVRQPITLPVQETADIVTQLWQGVTPRTKVIFVSHITSPTALRMPVETICARARQAGILTVIDGAHAPGQIPLDLTAIQADFYTGNFHKWLCTPKGSAFLYARRELQPLLQPLVVSWGWESDTPGDSPFLDYFQWPGTHDPSAYLTVPAGIVFQEQQNWPAVRQQCHDLAVETLHRLCDLTGFPPPYPDSTDFFQQMFIAELPPVDLAVLKTRLYEVYRVEVPLIDWNGRYFIRVSVQGYNTRDDMDVLLTALQTLLPQVRTQRMRDSAVLPQLAEQVFVPLFSYLFLQFARFKQFFANARQVLTYQVGDNTERVTVPDLQSVLYELTPVWQQEAVRHIALDYEWKGLLRDEALGLAFCLQIELGMYEFKVQYSLNGRLSPQSLGGSYNGRYTDQQLQTFVTAIDAEVYQLIAQR